MYNAKEILDATIKGTPERYSNNYEGIRLLFNPFVLHNPKPKKGEENIVDAWGVTNSYPEGVPGAFPVHTPEKIVLKDFENWKDYVKAPSLKFTDEEWAMFKEQYDAVDGSQAFKASFIAPGIFERMHHCAGIENALMAFYEYPDEVEEFIKYILDWEMELAEGICTHLKPEALFHHDDFGSMKSTFISPDMFGEYFGDAYHTLYGYYHDHGCKYVFHHSDSYGATLVPTLIDIGIDVWQGCMSSNNLPELVKKYGDKITFMGGFDGAMVDRADATPEMIKKCVYEVLDAIGTPKGFIPCIAQGGPGSVFPQVYHWLIDAVDEYNVEKFGIRKEDIVRPELQILF
ncbi:MAG: uroporphyrinogen decarboxylase family protein [Eubacteriales bacterium]|nr:uroporphyrinogen decarboxylase family protein [Eubacteriales bacterium]